ncbi:hypothetical protein MgSA37_01268 [Mucilaginibacter gotjawali]|uniref:Uncharacterized protein n=2 Tax=Mucilaginibacter gotjawali TaxID=1550579 RepID=A0A839SE80_9SPHI|nr:hypothetical protein [Mucilaginibacter gotjawali]BAU53101.1 hypothetical protein MgSA37_01268 [Mucilaginibacter gotjawali]
MYNDKISSKTQTPTFIVWQNYETAINRTINNLKAKTISQPSGDLSNSTTLFNPAFIS